MHFYQSLTTQFRGYNRNIKLSFMANILTQIGMGVFMVIYNFYIRKLGMPETVNGQIISMASLATALILVPAGLISDRFGRRKVIFYSIVVSGLILLLRSVMAVQDSLVFLAFAGGLTMAFSQVSGIPWMAENSKAEERVNLFSLHFALMTGANVIGNLLGGFLNDGFSLFLNDVNSIRLTLIIGALIFLVGAFPASKFQEKLPVKSEGKAVEPVRKLNWKSNGLKMIFLFAVSQLLIGFGAGLVIPYLNLYFADRFSAPTSAIGLIISLGQAATALAMIIGPQVVKRVGEVRAVVFLQLSSLPFLLLTAFAHHLWIAALGFLFRQALMNAANPIQSSLMMEKVDDSVKGLGNSINQMVFNLGWALMGPVSMGVVSEYGSYWGYAYVFCITAVLYLVGSTYFLLVFRGMIHPGKKTVSAKAV